MARASLTLADWVSDLPRPAVACAIVRIAGSAPQDVGARMWVTNDRSVGTLGGGRFESDVIRHSRELLRSGKASPRLKEYVLCKETGQCCGGRVEVFFEPVAAGRSVVLFGGGHVGRALAEVLSKTPLDAEIVDPRPEQSSREGLAQDIQARHADPLEYARSRSWGENDAVCVFTHSHELDFLLVSFFLPQPVGYLGLIGSEHKADVFKARLRSLPDGEKLLELWEEKMHCPMGLPLDSKNPKVIAVSIAAELLKVWGLKGAEPAAASGRIP